MNTLQHWMHQLLYTPGEPLLFSSGLFWALFLIFLPIYAALKRSRLQMTVFVVAFSFYFYYKCSGAFVLMLFATSVIDWWLSHAIVKTAVKWKRRLCLGLSLTFSLSVLAYFKYANFFMWNWHAMMGSNFAPMDIILPVGISFYTFQSVSYIVDVYNGRLEPTKHWMEYAFFLAFFPALVAGPIVRADYFLPQVEKNRQATRLEIYLGLWLIILGIVKKAIVADYIAQYNDLIFSLDPATGLPTYSGFETFMGIIGYTMQIYCDFSGYSDMAIGLALIMGFKLAQNFNFPYKARNLTDFWRRWHISLSTWLRDYVYIPLGGNRKGTARTYLNNFLTMLVGGLWHGAAWKFIIWGAMHGGGLAVHKAAKPHLAKIPDTWPIKALSWLITFTFVVLTMTVFRADTVSDAATFVSHAITDFSPAYAAPFLAVRWLWLLLVMVIVVSHCLPTNFWDKAAAWFVRSAWWVKLVIFLVVIQLVVELRSEEVAPFIYFQF